jgi:hypothetical protein
MTRPPRIKELYRRTLAIVVAAVAVATTACGSPIAVASKPTSGPVTADSVRMAFSNSTMDNAHFRLRGTLVKNRTYYPFTGDGIYQLRPVEALLMNINLQTYSGHGATRMQDVTINGRLYTRTGTGKWTSTPTIISPVAVTSYIGEEIIDGKAVWHAQSAAGRTTYDLWIRESDSYIVQIKYGGVSSTFTMIFDSYNTSREITTPKN